MWNVCRNDSVIRSLIFVWITAAVCAQTGVSWALEHEHPWDLEKLYQAPNFRLTEKHKKPGVTTFFYDGLEYEGKPTRVFAYYGEPEMKPGQKVPAMILVHGGGGTAFDEWVRLWNAKGYAAIAMDLEGQYPTPRDPELGRQKQPWHGPRNVFFSDAGKPITDQWMYHAVADVILANSLLRSFDNIDPERVGVTGISWGGVISSNVVGIDNRFAFAAIVYGCGHLHMSGNHFQAAFERMSDEQRDLAIAYWDGSSHLNHARMPIFWINGINDNHFYPPIFQASYECTDDHAWLLMKVGLGHSHPHGWDIPEIYNFADMIIRSDNRPLQVLDCGSNSSMAWTVVSPGAAIQSAMLNWTLDAWNWPQKEWNTTPAAVDPQNRKITAKIPEGTIACYFNITDENDMTISSTFITGRDHKPDKKE